jgi:hypothetical protein
MDRQKREPGAASTVPGKQAQASDNSEVSKSSASKSKAFDDYRTEWLSEIAKLIIETARSSGVAPRLGLAVPARDWPACPMSFADWRARGYYGIHHHWADDERRLARVQRRLTEALRRGLVPLSSWGDQKLAYLPNEILAMFGGDGDE